MSMFAKFNLIDVFTQNVIYRLGSRKKTDKIQARTYIIERVLDKLHEPSMEQRPGTQGSFSQLSAQITRLQTLAPSCVLSLAQ